MPDNARKHWLSDVWLGLKMTLLVGAATLFGIIFALSVTVIVELSLDRMGYVLTGFVGIFSLVLCAISAGAVYEASSKISPEKEH